MSTEAASHTATSTAAAPMAPVSASERIATLDILRGFALFGILLVNMMFFSTPLMQAIGAVRPAAANTLDAIAHAAILFFAQGKFYSLFSFLFGLGFSIQLARAAARGQSGARFFARRLAMLLLIGLPPRHLPSHCRAPALHSESSEPRADPRTHRQYHVCALGRILQSFAAFPDEPAGRGGICLRWAGAVLLLRVNSHAARAKLRMARELCAAGRAGPHGPDQLLDADDHLHNDFLWLWLGTLRPRRARGGHRADHRDLRRAIPFSLWWLSKFQMGPAEWLWRTLTYGKAQPMRA